MKTAISLPDELFDAGERLAERLGLTRSALYRKALARFIEQHTDRLVRERLDEVYGSGGTSSDVDPVLERMQTASLEPEEW